MKKWICVPTCGRAQLALLACVVAAFAVTSAARAFAQTTSSATYKVAWFNIQSGKGEPPLRGRIAPFVDTTNCTDPLQPLNAWGVNFIQPELLSKIGNDPSVLALGLAEAWRCGSPENVRAVLGWAARSIEKNGVGIVARYGFDGPVEWQQLDTTNNTNPADTKWIGHAAVCVDAWCSASVHVYFAHWYGSGTYANSTSDTQAKQSLAFMNKLPAGMPHVIVGDLNVWEGSAAVCNQNPKPTYILDNLRDAGYIDAWAALKGSDPGFTGMTNRSGCGVPEGATWKRIDYAWSRHISPVSISQFAVVPGGEAAHSDHYGIIAEYPLPGGAPEPAADVTAPLATITAPAEGATVSGTVSVEASASDAVGVTRVEFVADGELLATDTAAPYSTSWNTTALANGAHSLQARAYDAAGNMNLSALRMVNVSNVVLPPPPASDQVTWVNPVNLAVIGGSITKSSGCTTCADAGAVSQQEITNDGGFVEFVPTTNARLFAGLGTDRSASTASASIAYAFSFWPTGTWDIREAGIYRLEGAFVAGDRFRIAIEGGLVVYYHNRTIVYRSKVAPTLPLVVDASIYTLSGAVTNATIQTGAPVALKEILLYASAAKVVGSAWHIEPDATSASGSLLRNPDAALAKVTSASAAPPSYAELTFAAEAGRPYRLWIRSRAEKNYYGNDSAFVQFSDSVDASGAAMYRIGTTGSTTYILEDCSGCGLAGWGWQDNAYGVSALGPVIYFAASGTHTLRIQSREDGLAIDQIVLSSERHITTSPGATKNDSTILIP